MEPDDSGETVEVFDSRLEETTAKRVEPENLYKDNDWLHLNYVVLDRSVEDISRQFGIQISDVREQLQNHEIGGDKESAWIGNAPWKNKEWLQHEYHDKKKSLPKIAADWSVSVSLLFYYMEKYGIPTRSRSEARILWEESHGGDEKYKDEEWLRRQYRDLRKPAGKIATEVDADVSTNTIQYFLHKFDIEVRTDSEAALLRQGRMVHLDHDESNRVDVEGQGESDRLEQTTNKVGLNSYTGPSLGIDSTYKTIDESQSDAVYSPWRDKEWLEHMYGRYGHLTKIANICGTVQATIINWMDHHGLERQRPTKENYTLGEFASAIQSCASELDEPLSFQQYYRWARNTDDVPHYLYEVCDGDITWLEGAKKAGVLTPKMDLECPTGDELKQLRNDADLTQKQLAEIIDTHKDAISMIETGNYVPKADLGSRINAVDWNNVEPVNPIKCPIGTELRELRLDAGVSQAELGNIVNLSSHTISRAERGATSVTKETADKINAIDWKEVKRKKQERLECPTGDRLRELRENAGVTQATVADHIDKPSGTYGQVENDVFEPREELASKLRNIDWDQLEREKDDPVDCPTGDELRSLREDVGASQNDVATQIGISPNSVSDIEAERFEPSTKMAKKINNIDWDLLEHENKCPTGDELRELRKEAGLTQKELADRIGCNQGTISHAERGETQPSKENAIQINTIDWDSLAE
jgi:DNA-binding XRE family transcriptional regulator